MSLRFTQQVLGHPWFSTLNLSLGSRLRFRLLERCGGVVFRSYMCSYTHIYVHLYEYVSNWEGENWEGDTETSLLFAGGESHSHPSSLRRPYTVNCMNGTTVAVRRVHGRTGTTGRVSSVVVQVPPSNTTHLREGDRPWVERNGVSLEPTQGTWVSTSRDPSNFVIIKIIGSVLVILCFGEFVIKTS